MYVSVPKNYSGIAFPRTEHTQRETPRRDMTRQDMPMPPTMPLSMPPAMPQIMQPSQPQQARAGTQGEACRECREPQSETCRECREPPGQGEQDASRSCDGCQKQDKNPLTCLLTALRDRGKAGFDTEDFLLIGLIVLLLGKEGNEDIVLILAMLLLI